MRIRIAVALALLASIAVTGTPAQAASPAGAAKKCFKKKKGKRVRVKCPKKKAIKPRQPSTPTGAPPMSDPAAISALAEAVQSQTLHHFSTNGAPGSFGGDERLSLCPDGSYIYSATLDSLVLGLTGAAKVFESGHWRVTGAEFSSARGRIDGGLLLVPSDASGVHLATLAVVANTDGYVAPYVSGDRWYLSPGGPCG